MYDNNGKKNWKRIENKLNATDDYSFWLVIETSMIQASASYSTYHSHMRSSDDNYIIIHSNNCLHM